MRKGDTYLSQGEINQILEMAGQGIKMQEIADKIGRSRSTVYLILAKHSGEMKVAKVMPTPREMIKALYEKGYRIENNEIVYYEKHVVKIHDIITEQ